MTLSLVARDPSTDTFGMVITSSSPAVAARCVHLRHGVGGAASQNITLPTLGEALLDALATGLSAEEALGAVVESTHTAPYRQLTVVDAKGHSAVFSGERALGRYNQRHESNLAAAGNMLSHDGVIDALVQGFLASAATELERRLLDGLVAALASGGEAGPVHSAGLVVTSPAGWYRTDLRVDWSDTPVRDLEDLWNRWAPQRDDYLLRGTNPSLAPSYGVPGDE